MTPPRGRACTVVGVALVATLACGQVRSGIGTNRATPPADDSGAMEPRGTPLDSGGGPGPDICPGSLIPLHRLPGRSPCAWALPDDPGPPLDIDKINVRYEDNVGPRYLIDLGTVANAAECGASLAWYFDSPVAPSAILGCPAMCAFAGSAGDGGLPGAFVAVLGCSLVPRPLF